MKGIIILKKKKEQTEIDRQVIEQLEMDVEELNGIDRANFDMTTFKLYVDFDEDEDGEEVSQAEISQAVLKRNIFRVVNIYFN